MTLNTPNSLLTDGPDGTKNLKKTVLATYSSKADLWEFPAEGRRDRPDAGEQEGVKLTAVKQGGNFWYFLDDVFVMSEQIDFMDAEVIPAIYAWAADVEFKEYSCKEASPEEIRSYLNEHGVYSVDVRVNGGGGTAEASKIAVSDGQTYDIAFSSNSGYEPSSILVNGRECIEDARENAKNGVYSVVCDGTNQDVVVSFAKVDGQKLNGIVYGNDVPISATLTVTSDTNGLLRYVISAKDDKGYVLMVPKGTYTIIAEAVNFVTARVAVTVEEDHTEDITLMPSMFASQVKFGGRSATSNMDAWDRTYEAEGRIYGSYNRGTSEQPLYFAETGKSAWFHSTIRYSSEFVEGGSYQSDLLGGLFVSDGARSGWFGIRQHGIVYNLNWIEHVIGYDVLSLWNKQHLTATVDIILKDGLFYIYVDDVFTTTLPVTKVIPGADPNAELALGLAMHADKMCDIEFSDIRFTTDAEKIAEDFEKKQAEHTVPDGNVFTQTVTVNGVSLESKPYTWNLSEIGSNTVTGIDGMSSQPIWLKKTGNAALIQTTISRVDNFKGTTGFETQPMAGIMISDGERQGYFGIRASAVVTNDNWDHCIGRDIMASWSNTMSAELTVALLDDEFHVFVDGVLVKTVKVSDVIPGVQPGAVLALGVTTESSGKTASVKFANVEHTTDREKVTSFLDSKDPRKSVPAGTLFAGVVDVNGKEAESVTAVWDLSEIQNNIVTAKNGLSNQPLYFAKTGNTALVRTTVTRMDDKSETGRETQPMAGIVLTDGTHSGFIGVRAYSVVYGSTWLEKAIGYDVFVTWSQEHQTADVDFVLKDGKVQVYVDGIFTKEVAVSDIAPGIVSGSTVAVGLVMESSGKTARMKFANVRYSTSEADAEAYLEEASGDDLIPKDSIFASKVTVNGAEVQSIVPVWDLSEIENHTVTGTNGSASQPLYFKATGNAALLRMTATRMDDKTTENRETQPMAGLFINDGTHTGAVGVRASAVVTTANNDWDHCIGRDLFATWSTVTTANVSVAVRNNEIFVFVDDVLKKKIALSTAVPGIASDAAAAFGLVMESSGKNAVMKFSDVTFTTDEAEVDAYLEEQSYDPSIQDFIEYARALGQRYENGTGSDKIDVTGNTTVFIGDSFFERKRFWTKFYTDDYPAGDVFLAGIGSTTTAHWKHLTDIVFKAFGDESPKNIVMHLGTNDLWPDTATADDVVNGLKALFDQLHAKYPSTPIYYFGITHRGDRSAADRIDAANGAIRSYAEATEYLTYINTPAKITADMLNADKLHPKAETYTIFVRELAKAGCVILDKNGDPLPAPEFQSLGGLFADEVTVNGKTVTSANEQWTIDRTDENILEGSYAEGSSLTPIYFASTGRTMLTKFTVSYTTEFETDHAYQGDLMGGLYVSDGTNTGYFGVRQHGVVYSPWMEWIENAWPYCVMSKWEPAHMTAEVAIALQDDVFHIFVDGAYSTTLPLSKIMGSTSSTADLAFALTMHADKDADIRFSNVTFTTDETEVDAFLNPAASFESDLFAETVTVNEKTLTSVLEKWDLEHLDEVKARATSELGSSLQPLYFKETGRSMLLHMKVKVTSDTEKDPMAGVWLSDGTRRVYLGIRGNSLLYSPENASWNAWVEPAVWSYSLFTPQWGGNQAATIDIALKDDVFHIRLDGQYNTTYSLTDLMPNLSLDDDIAFALIAFTEGTRALDMTFSEITFTTEEDAVDAFLNPTAPADALFAAEVTVNEQTLNSAVAKWDMTKIEENTLRAAQELGSHLQPYYFASTGVSALLSTTVTVTSTTKGDPMAGLWMHDGTGRAFIGVRGGGLYYAEKGKSWDAWYGEGKDWPTQELAPGWGGSATAKIDILVKDGTITVYVDDTHSKSLPLSVLFPSLESGTNLAFGLVSYTYSDRAYDMTFKNVQFTTDDTEIAAFIASKT